MGCGISLWGHWNVGYDKIFYDIQSWWQIIKRHCKVTSRAIFFQLDKFYMKVIKQRVRWKNKIKKTYVYDCMKKCTT